MHFQVIKDDYYNGILSRIKEYFPEYNSVFDEQDGVYPILGELGTFITNNVSDEGVLQSSAGFINEAVELGKSNTEDVIVLQIFQKFYEKSDLTKLEQLLSSKAKIIYDEYRKEFNHKR